MKIPVRLAYKGKEYTGELDNPSGSGGGDQWELLINQSRRGVLSFQQRDGWCFQTQAGRFDEWVLVIGKLVQDALPDRDFTLELPPPYKMFEFGYEGEGLKAIVEVHCLHGGGYYVHIKDRFVHGRAKEGFDQTYFSRRQHDNDKPFWHFTHYWYKDLFESVGDKVEEFEKGSRKIESY